MWKPDTKGSTVAKRQCLGDNELSKVKEERWKWKERRYRDHCRRTETGLSWWRLDMVQQLNSVCVCEPVKINTEMINISVSRKVRCWRKKQGRVNTRWEKEDLKKGAKRAQNIATVQVLWNTAGLLSHLCTVTVDYWNRRKHKRFYNLYNWTGHSNTIYSRGLPGLVNRDSWQT